MLPGNTWLFPSSEHDKGCQVGALVFSSKWCPPRWQWCAAVILLNRPRHSLSEMDWTPQWVRRQTPSSLGRGGCPCALALPSAPGKPLTLRAQSLLARGCSGRPAGIRRGSARNRARNAKCQCQNSGPSCVRTTPPRSRWLFAWAHDPRFPSGAQRFALRALHALRRPFAVRPQSLRSG